MCCKYCLLTKYNVVKGKSNSFGSPCMFVCFILGPKHGTDCSESGVNGFITMDRATGDINKVFKKLGYGFFSITIFIVIHFIRFKLRKPDTHVSNVKPNCLS